MAAHVSSLARMLSGYVKEEGDGRKREMVTWDLLGGAAVLGLPELDLDHNVPAGWIRGIDLTSGQTYLQERSTEFRSIQDLNFRPPSVQHPPAAAAAVAISLFPEACTNLDLKLSLSAAPPRAVAAVAEYSSVCTLEKVKNALERAEHESRPGVGGGGAVRPLQLPFSLIPLRPEGSLAVSPSVSSTTSSSSSMKRRRSSEAAAAVASASAAEAGDGSETSVGAAAEEGEMAVVACPACLMYVMVSMVEPSCPKCAAHVHIKLSNQKKKAKLNLDLNSIQTDNDE